MNYAFSRNQEAWDRKEPPDFDEPASMPTLLELQQENFTLREQLTQLLEEARNSGEKLNRIQCCAGDRLLRLCNEIEGVPEDQAEDHPQEEYEA